MGHASKGPWFQAYKWLMAKAMKIWLRQLHHGGLLAFTNICYLQACPKCQQPVGMLCKRDGVLTYHTHKVRREAFVGDVDWTGLLTAMWNGTPTAATEPSATETPDVAADHDL